MAAQVDIVLNAIDKTKGAIQGTITEIGKAERAYKKQNADFIAGQQKIKESFANVTGAIGLATGAFYAANAALDGIQKRYEELNLTEQANEIERSQIAWQALADTLLVIGGSDIVSAISQISVAAAEAARQIAVLTSLNENNLVKSTMNVLFPMVGIANSARDAYNWINKVDTKQADAAIAAKASQVNQASISASMKKQADELQKQLDKYNSINDALDEGIAKRDPAAIRKAQGELAKFNAENPNFVSSGKGGVSVTIVGGGMKDVVTQVIIDGTKQDPNYLDPTRGY